ncbi:MAG: aldo/keto reductase, partial [Thermodesulfobacteriota bacterium]
MLYRKLGKANLNVSILGFGCMRLPILNGSGSGADIFDPNKDINEEETIKMIRYAIDQGVNYFDTAYPYHSGKSEPLLGKAVNGYRDKVMIATKLPVWLTKEERDFNKFLDEQMKRLGIDYLDVYLLHGLNQEVWSKVRQLKVLEFLDRIRVDGRVRHVGFSFHDEVKIFKEIVDSYDWEICQIQYNFFDENYQAGKEG